MSVGCPLSSALLSCLTGGEGAPLKVSVEVTPSDEVVALRTRVSELEGELAALRIAYNRTEYLYGCEVRLNLQLQDLMRVAGVPFPRRLCTTSRHGEQR